MGSQALEWGGGAVRARPGSEGGLRSGQYVLLFNISGVYACGTTHRGTWGEHPMDRALGATESHEYVWSARW